MHEPILVTGAAGFIGFHVARRLLEDGHAVVGLDNLNSYYDPRPERCAPCGACQARRFSIYPKRYFRSRWRCGAIRRASVCLRGPPRRAGRRALFARSSRRLTSTPISSALPTSSRAVATMDASTFCTRLHRRCMAPTRGLPFRTSDNVDHPLNLYGATKKANELMAHAYAHLFAIPATGLRFFTVYGPWGRPDMAMWLFTAAIMQGSPSACSTTDKCGATSPTSMT